MTTRTGACEYISVRAYSVAVDGYVVAMFKVWLN